MPEGSNVDVVDKYQKAFRSAAGEFTRGYSCYLCHQSFPASNRVWAHAKLEHPGHPDIANFEDEAEAKRRFLETVYVTKVLLL